MKTLLTISTLIFMSTLSAQHNGADKVNKEAVTQLAFIVGDWKGEGWMLGRDGVKRAFTQTETIRFKLDSTVILIEGMGLDQGRIIHDAMAILSFNKLDSTYSFHSYLSTGKEGKFRAELIEGRLYWYPNEHMRYTILINDNGEWYETGETRSEEQWVQFFEMTLARQ